MKKPRFLYFVVFVCALLVAPVVQGADYVWYMDTNTGESIAVDEVDYLLRSDGADDFSVVVKNSNPIVGVSQVTFSKKQSTAVGTERVEAVRFYPNPVQETLYMSGLPEGGLVEIMALDGRVMKRVVVTGPDLTVSVVDLPQGSYLLKTANTVLKFIKR